jgi:hypothetical protein
VPEFTLKLVAYPYDVAPTTTINPYTGNIVITQAGHHVENRSIEIAIKKQPFTQYKDFNGNNVTLMYNIGWKGHFENSWNYYAGKADTADNTNDYFHASSSEFSVVVGGLSWNENSAGYNFFVNVPSEGTQGGQIDFQVRALVGYSNRVYAGDSIPLGAVYYYNFTGETSDWSNTQSINITDGSVSNSPSNSTPTLQSSPPTATSLASPSQNPTATPIQPISGSPAFFALDFGEIVIIALLGVVAVLLGLVTVYLGRRKR